MSKLKKMGYLIIREDINSPLINSQVLDVLGDLQISHGNNIILIWLYRIDYFFKNPFAIKNLKNKLSQKEIKLIALPFISGKFPISWWEIPYLVQQWVIYLCFVTLKYKINFIHCRSYNSGITALILSKFLKVKFIFDPRSPFPEEKVAAGLFKENSLNYKFWKKIEFNILKSASATIATSKPFAQDLAEINHCSNIQIIPNNYPQDFHKKSYVNSTERTLIDPHIQLCYIGSLGHWNDVNLYLNFFENFIKSSKNKVTVHFIVPESSRIELTKTIIKSELQKNISIKSIAQNDVFKTISGYTLGVYLMEKKDARLGVKFVEYLAAGLPVIVSETILGASAFVNENNLGLVIRNINDIQSAIAFAEEVNNHRIDWKQKCEDFAKNNFSTEIVANRIHTLYNEVNNNSDYVYK